MKSIGIVFLLIRLSASLESTNQNESKPQFQINLNKNWTLINAQRNITIPNLQLPVSVHTALWQLQPNDPFYRFNDLHLRWIVNDDNWLFKTEFELDMKQLTNETIISLEFDSIDTIASVFLNRVFILFASNQFLKYELFDIGYRLKEFNLLEVFFSSPVKQAQNFATFYPYRIPPECPPDVQKGECHVNFLRKEQCSFSWDWGPAFAPIGLYGNVNLNIISRFSFNFSASVYPENRLDLETWILDLELRIVTGVSDQKTALVVLKLDDLNFRHNESLELSGLRSNKNFQVKVERLKGLELWWPNGFGKQALYNLTIEVIMDGFVVSKNKAIGFRSVELVQEPIKDANGLSFYFKINNQPIFLKGSNWIPAHVFQESITEEYVEWLIKSAKMANMNVLRVWGGGVYESSAFYTLADQYGIMIWQDFMFACSTYPTNRDYLFNVESEVTYQVNRLRNHPSIILWAGNNENEAALATNWYNTSDDQETYANDYRKLYIEVIMNVVKKIDVSRPFLSSSPTNGLESMKENWIAKNPYDLLNGDLHFYDYEINGWDPTSYPIPRFMSEFGVQSLPSFSTLAEVYSMPGDADFFGELNMHRQHHANGNQQILDEISKNLKVPNVTDSVQNFKNMIYLSQVSQAMTLKTASELFRRSKSFLDSKTGTGKCMGTMYWQFNDIWQAPTWSSIEFMSSGGVNKCGKWKLAHYYIKNAYAPVILSPVWDGRDLFVYAVSDLTTNFSSTFNLKLFSFDSFTPKFTQKNVAFDVNASQSNLVMSLSLDMKSNGCGDLKCFFQIDSDDERVQSGSRNFIFLDNKIDLSHLSKAPRIQWQVTETSRSGVFAIWLVSDSVALFVQLDMATTSFYGVFSDNGFHMTDASCMVTYESSTANLREIESYLQVSSLADVY